MNQLSVYKLAKNQKPTCSDLMTMAERELAAFFSAVTVLFGSEQASLSGGDWLHELLAMNGLPTSTREWRLMTLEVAARLARRVSPSSVSSASQTPADAAQSYCCAFWWALPHAEALVNVAPATSCTDGTDENSGKSPSTNVG